jgi:tRNA(fMet)-specific endonuclease VapC
VKYVLDTNAVSALMKGERVVTERLKRTAKSDVSVPGPVLAEIAYGIERLPRSKRRQVLRRQYDLIRGEIGREPWSDAVSAQFGVIKATLERRAQMIEDFDVAIAAHALAAKAVLVTANLDPMTRIPGLTVEDWGKSI